jgi:hypothetical protein
MEQAVTSHPDKPSGGAVKQSMRRRPDAAIRVLWRDHLRVGLSAEGLPGAMYRRGLRPRLTDMQTLGIAAPHEGPAWRASVEALRTTLEPIGQRRTDVTVVLSNYFVRYALLPWNGALKRDADWLAFARHRFAAVHGNATDDWVVRVCNTGHQRPRIASAIDHELLLALEQAMPSRMTLRSVQPYLTAAYNRLQHAIVKEQSWFVVEEPGRLTVALIDQGYWKAVRTRRRDVSSGMTLLDILDRENALLALEEPCFRVVLCSHLPSGNAGLREPYRIEDLTFPPDIECAERQLAMVVE